MIKTRPNFREDNVNMKQSSNNITVIKNIDEEPIRGRKMTTSNMTKKNNSTTCDSKDRNLKKGKIRLIPEKKIGRKNIRRQSESENSFSDHSVKKRKPVYKGKKEVISDNISEDETLVSANYEDNLFNEIERILIEIINNHINSDFKKNEMDIVKFERHVNVSKFR
jgi:hypothetical protein